MAFDREPGSPLPALRREGILELLATDGAVRAQELAARFEVDAVTIRRDLSALEKQGLLTRVHGGAIVHSLPDDAPALQPQAYPERRVGVLVPSLTYYWLDVVRAIELAAPEFGLKPILRTSSYEAIDERPILEHLVSECGVEGLLLAPQTDGPGSPALTRWLVKSQVPFVLVERELRNPQNFDLFDSVMSDHALGTSMAVHHLAGLGHRRVGLVSTKRSPTTRRIVMGWRAACHELGLERDDRFEHLALHQNMAQFGEFVDDIISAVINKGTTALLVHSDREAFEIVQRATARGLKVPSELSVMAYDDVIAGIGDSPLSAVAPQRESLGRSALELLTQRISQPDRPVHRVLVSPRINSRASTAAAPRS